MKIAEKPYDRQKTAAGESHSPAVIFVLRFSGAGFHAGFTLPDFHCPIFIARFSGTSTDRSAIALVRLKLGHQAEFVQIQSVQA